MDDDFYRDIERRLDVDAEREPRRLKPLRPQTDEDRRERLLLAAGSALVYDPNGES